MDIVNLFNKNLNINLESHYDYYIDDMNESYGGNFRIDPTKISSPIYQKIKPFNEKYVFIIDGKFVFLRNRLTYYMFKRLNEIYLFIGTRQEIEDKFDIKLQSCEKIN
jgi:hypothetical protein